MFGWLEQFVTNDVARFGLWAVYITMSLESACIPIPSEVVMPYAGRLVAKGQYALWQVGFVAALANLTGSIIAYSVGRFGGRAFIERYGRYVFLSRKHLAMADRWFENRGDITVLVSRMLPAVRTFISLPAGIAKMNFFRFCIYSFIGALPWNLALAYVGIVFTDKWDLMKVYIHKFNLVAYVLMALAVVSYFIWRRKRK